MKFEEQFPSLKEHQSHSGEYGDYDRGDNVVSCDSVQEHCFDKQKVRAVLRKQLTTGKYHEAKTEAIANVLEELGLEDTQTEKPDMDDFVNPGVTIELIQKYHTESGDLK